MSKLIHSKYPPENWIQPVDDLKAELLEALSPELINDLQMIRPERISAIWKSLESIKWGGRKGAVFSRQFSIFALGGYYPEVDRILGYANDHPGGTGAWLQKNIQPELMANSKLLVVGSRPEAFLLSSRLFVSNWSAICERSHEVVFVLPPQEDWLLVWHCTGAYFAFCRRNPEAQTFFLDLPPDEAERIVAGECEEVLYLPIANPQSYPEGDQLRRVRIDYPRALLPAPEAALDDCAYYPLSPAALEQALQVCLLEPHEMALDALRRLDDLQPEPDFPFGWKEGTRTWRQAIAEGRETNSIWLQAYRWASPRRAQK